MKEYFISVFVLSLFLGILEKFLYKENGVIGEKKALALVLVFAVASPLPGIFQNLGALPDLPEYSPDIEGGAVYEEVTKEAFEEGLKRQIADEFSLKKECVEVRVSGFSFEEMRAEKITVILSLAAANADPSRIEEYVNELSIGVCEVYFEIG